MGSHGAVEYRNGQRSNAFLDGEVLDVPTHAEFEAILRQHEDDTVMWPHNTIVFFFASHSLTLFSLSIFPPCRVKGSPRGG